MKLEFSSQFFEKLLEISNLLEIRPVGAELFHADGRTDRQDEANCRVSQLCERAKKKKRSDLKWRDMGEGGGVPVA